MNVLPFADKRAEALAQIQEMSEALNKAMEENAQLRADINRAEDRIEMLREDRDRFRHESIRFRKLALRQAVEMVDALLILERAKDTLQEMDEIDEAATPPTEAIDRLAVEFRKGSE